MKNVLRILFVALLSYLAFGCRKELNEPSVIDYWREPTTDHAMVVNIQSDPLIQQDFRDIAIADYYMWYIDQYGEFEMIEGDVVTKCTADSAFIIRLVSTGQACYYAFGHCNPNVDNCDWMYMAENEARDVRIPIGLTNQERFWCKVTYPYEGASWHPASIYADYHIQLYYTKLWSKKVKK
jgi:hypothetical protein